MWSRARWMYEKTFNPITVNMTNYQVQVTNLREKDLEQRIEEALLSRGYEKRTMEAYDKVHALDVSMVLDFLKETQPTVYDKLRLYDASSSKRFLDRLSGELKRKGVIEVLRSGISHEQCNGIKLYYALPDEDNATAKANHAKNTFGFIRQLAYSQPHVQDPGILDVGLYINGIPVVTMELKNEYSGQNVKHAIEQYKNDRDPKEPLFVPGRCVVHFAVDTHEVFMCTMLNGKRSRFLPFNKGKADGSAGNPANPNGFATAYLWEDILQPASLCDIIEHYACKVEEEDKKDKKKKVDIFPRYHQLDATRKLLADVQQNGVGQQYLIQHSAGSGKSNTITWLVLQLTNTRGADGKHAFDAVVVVTDRRNLDKQIDGNISKFSRMNNILHADKGSQLGDALSPDSSIRIVVSTIQKFPVVLKQMQELQNKKFAIVIDEAHSSQGGENAAALNTVLGLAGAGECKVQDDDELMDILAICASKEEQDIQIQAHRRAKLRKLVQNASYFAFTATPKIKTLRMFGQLAPDGTYRPFHHYSMKQAIQEGFILDVLACYTPIESYFRLKPREGYNTSEKYDAKQALSKLKKLAESDPAAIKQKAHIMVEHFLTQGSRQIAGQARAMVICASIQRAIEYYHAIEDELKRQNSHFRAIVAFSGEKEFNGEKLDEARINGFASSMIENKIQEDPYRILVVADKFLTGYDEPLLQTMYVDKKLSGVKTVQTLSRLNRSRADKYKTFVLDFYNNAESIRADFEPYYMTTVLSGDFDANKLHDLKDELDNAGVYTYQQVTKAIGIYLTMEKGNQELGAVLDESKEVFEGLSLDEQIHFKSTAKAFVRYYDFLSTVLPYANVEWEKLSCFLRELLKILPRIGKEEDDRLTDAAEMDGYRAEVGNVIRIALAGEVGEMQPTSPTTGGGVPEPDMKPLSDILSQFHDLFGNIEWKDEDNVRAILDKLAPEMSKNINVADAMANSDEENIRLELKKAIDDYLAAQIRLNSGRMDDITKLTQKYEDKDNGFASRLLDCVLHQLRRKRWEKYQDCEEEQTLMAAESET